MPAGMEIRRKRQEIIREILRSQPIARQAELVAILRERGIDATQSSVSRDLKQLGMAKVEQGYAAPTTADSNDLSPVAGLIRNIEPAGGSLTVIKTAVGAAQRVAVFLDRSDWPEIVGTVSGDDTIFVATKTAAHQRQLLVRLRSNLSQ
jgi:transcriptional regulator of arginine metabolism